MTFQLYGIQQDADRRARFMSENQKREFKVVPVRDTNGYLITSDCGREIYDRLGIIPCHDKYLVSQSGLLAMRFSQPEYVEQAA